MCGQNAATKVQLQCLGEETGLKVTEIREFIPTSAQVSDHNQVPLEDPKSKQASVKLDDPAKLLTPLLLCLNFD